MDSTPRFDMSAYDADVDQDANDWMDRTYESGLSTEDMHGDAFDQFAQDTQRFDNDSMPFPYQQEVTDVPLGESADVGCADAAADAFDSALDVGQYPIAERYMIGLFRELRKLKILQSLNSFFGFLRRSSHRGYNL